MQNLSQKLLSWYAKHGRDLPWRVKGGAHPDPYVILVSEFMLQQTTVATVIPYFEKFMKRFPTVYSLAAASTEDVYRYWQGLGYYARARSLHLAAQMIVRQYDGIFPQTREEVLKLKGIGDYTAASFLALAFNQPEAVVDGNVMRIICRLYHLTMPLEKLKDEIKSKAVALVSYDCPADYTSAVMDLGATVCTPKKPRCLVCPWQESCLSKNLPDIENIPVRRRLEKKEKYGNVYVISDSKDRLFIRKRTEKGLLSGLYEFPWSENILFAEAENSGIEVTHIFTHFKLVLKIYTMKSDAKLSGGIFVSPNSLTSYPFSTLMKKVYSEIRDRVA